MHRVSLRLRPLVPETRCTEGTIPEGSDEAKAAIERVRLKLLAGAHVPKTLSIKRPKGSTVMSPDNPIVGARVRVILVADDREHVGTLTGMTRVLNGRTAIVDCPEITLDDGRVIDGMECWWAPEDEARAREDTQ